VPDAEQWRLEKKAARPHSQSAMLGIEAERSDAAENGIDNFLADVTVQVQALKHHDGALRGIFELPGAARELTMFELDRLAALVYQVAATHFAVIELVAVQNDRLILERFVSVHSHLWLLDYPLP